MEREEALLWNLKEVIVALDTSTIGPAVKLLPRWQIERIAIAIEASEDELELLEEFLKDLPDNLEDSDETR